MHRLIDATTGTVIVPRLEAAPAFSRAAARGLLGRPGLAAGTGLLLSDPLRCVHTFGMRFPIDVVFLDAALRVVDVAEAVAPGRVVWRWRGRHQLELGAGRARELGLEPQRALRVVPLRRPVQGGRPRDRSPHLRRGSRDAAHESAFGPCAPVAPVSSIPPAAASADGPPPLPKGVE